MKGIYSVLNTDVCQYVHCYQNPIKHRISTITWLLIFGYLQNPYFWVMWLPTCIDADIFLHPSLFFILCVRYLVKPWHSKRLTKTDVSNKVDSKSASAHLCRLICDGLGLCMHNRDVLAGDFGAKGVGDIRNGERFRLHHRRLWEGSRHSGEWAENRFSHYINFTSHTSTVTKHHLEPLAKPLYLTIDILCWLSQKKSC